MNITDEDILLECMNLGISLSKDSSNLDKLCVEILRKIDEHNLIHKYYEKLYSATGVMFMADFDNPAPLLKFWITFRQEFNI